jgi:hypothetical protein
MERTSVARVSARIGRWSRPSSSGSRISRWRFISARDQGTMIVSVSFIGSGASAWRKVISISACGHPIRHLALCQVHAQLPGRRRAAGRAQARCVIRDDSALGPEIRDSHCTAPSAETPATDGSLASR